MKALIQLVRSLMSVAAKVVLVATAFFGTLFGMYAVRTIMHAPVNVTVKTDIANPKTENISHKYLTVAIVNSYNYKHICAKPQVDGFVHQLHIYEKHSNIRFIIISYYLESKLKNTTKFLIQKQANIILRDIATLNPDYIFTTDDNAFLYVGLPLVKQYKHVYFSGINFPFRYYKQFLSKDNLDYVSGVEEYIHLDKLFTLLDHTNITVTDAYVLAGSETHGSTTNKAILNNILEQLSKRNFQTSIYHISTTTELTQTLKRLNQQNLGLLFIVTQRVFDPASRRYIDALDICTIVSEVNKKHIEVSFNPILAQRAHICLTISPDFYNMGRHAANLMIHDLTKSVTEHRVEQTTTILSCSFDRLQQLGIEDIYLNNVNLFDKVF